MFKKILLGVGLLVIFAAATMVFVINSITSPKSYNPPERTAWAPHGPRALPYVGDETSPAGGDVLGYPTAYFRTLHADSINSDEIAIVTAPMFEADWVVETETFNPEGPTFDQAGNLYFSPSFSPNEDVMLISLDPSDGSRRWVVESPIRGSGSPLVLDDPDNPGTQIIYVGGYDRAIAVRPNADLNGDGNVEPSEMVWSVPTGLSVAADEQRQHMFGLNYDPTSDTLMGLTRDNHIYVLDRKTGERRLTEPYSLPDIAPSPARPPAEISERVQTRLEALAKPFFGEISFPELVGILLGNNTMVANYFSVDPHTGKVWIAATAPDDEDGTRDGVSEYGALYALQLLPNEDGTLRFEPRFHVSFAGGSASTPALSADGKRVYIGDNFGKLIAIDSTDGETIWELDVGEQIFGSISVASDNNELYLPAATNLIKVIDQGTSGTLAWRADLDAYPEWGINSNVRALTGTITANGIALMASSELNFGPGLIVSVGTGLLDRDTGELRYFVEGREDSIAVTAVGPDGSVYIAHSPIKRMFAAAVLGNRVPPLVGGIQKYTAVRLDLLIRDAIHAAADRAENVAIYGSAWSDELKTIEVKQISLLMNQAKAASEQAIADADLTIDDWTTINGYLTDAELALDVFDFSEAHQALLGADAVL